MTNFAFKCTCFPCIPFWTRRLSCDLVLFIRTPPDTPAVVHQMNVHLQYITNTRISLPHIHSVLSVIRQSFKIATSLLVTAPLKMCPACITNHPVYCRENAIKSTFGSVRLINYASHSHVRIMWNRKLAAWLLFVTKFVAYVVSGFCKRRTLCNCCRKTSSKIKKIAARFLSCFRVYSICSF